MENELDSNAKGEVIYNYLDKPFDIQYMREALKKYLDDNKIPYKDDKCNGDKGLDELSGNKDNNSDIGVS